jgi:hypothetical protein
MFIILFNNVFLKLLISNLTLVFTEYIVTSSVKIK